MTQRPKTSILIVDDSRLFRSALESTLAREDDIEVVGSVWNGKKAIEFIEKTPPDLVTLDIEMPELNGLETLEAIEKFNRSRPEANPVGAIMISSHTRRGADITVKALEMGAFDFIAKPEGGSLAANIGQLCQQLLTKIRLYTSRRITSRLLQARLQPPPSRPMKREPPPLAPPPGATVIQHEGAIRAILIGVSTGGPKALMEIMPSLCDKVEAPILIVQHMPPTFTQSLAKSLDSKCRHAVSEAVDGETVLAGRVYIAPGGRHLELRRQGGEAVTRITHQAPEKGCRPSVDVLFRSAAEVYGGDLIAVILTGMGEDGTLGAGLLKAKGAVILAQDEATSVVWGMPGSAAGAGHVDRLLPLADIPDAIVVTMDKANKRNAS